MLDLKTLDPKYRMPGVNCEVVCGGAALPFVLTVNEGGILYRVDLVSGRRQPLTHLRLGYRWLEVHPGGREFFVADNRALKYYALTEDSCELQISSENKFPIGLGISSNGRLLQCGECLYDTSDLSQPAARYDVARRRPPHVVAFDLASGCIYDCNTNTLTARAERTREE